jgi:hypothetical protein
MMKLTSKEEGLAEVSMFFKLKDGKEAKEKNGKS